MKVFTLIALMTLSLTAFANNKVDSINQELTDISIQESQCLDNDENSSTHGQLACLGTRYDALEGILNREYREIRKGEEGEYLKRLIQAQRDWLDFRVSNCAWKATDMLGGTGENVIYLGCMNSETDERIRELVEFYYTEL